MTGASDAASSVGPDLVGTWRLLTWEAIAEDGSITYPFGPAPLGYVVYTRDGHMITTLSASEPTSVGDGPPGEDISSRLAGFDSFVAYSGTFRLDGGDVIHRVEMSLNPDWVGTEQRRHVEFGSDGNELTLLSDPMATSGSDVRNRLRWRRAEG